MAAHQAPPSLGFSRQEHGSGLPFPSPKHESEKWKGSRSIVSNSLWPHGLQPTRLLCPWDFPGKSTGVGCHCLLRYIKLGAFKWKHIYNKVMCWVSDTNVVTRGSQELNPVFPRGRSVQCSLTQSPQCLYKTWLPQISQAIEKINVNWRRKATWTFRDHWMAAGVYW